MRARKRPTKVRQDQIVTAALDLIARKGIAALNAADLAGEVGLVPSGLYRHFPTLEAVLTRVLDLLGQRWSGTVATIRAQSQAPLERLRLLFAGQAQSGSEGAVILQLECSSSPLLDQAARQRLDGLYGDYLLEVRALLCAAQQEGTVAESVEPATAALVFSGTCLALTMSRQLGEEMPEGVADHAWMLYRHAIGQPSHGRPVVAPVVPAAGEEFLD